MGTKIKNFIGYIKSCLLAIIYPSLMRCLCCGKDIDSMSLCCKCKKGIKRNSVIDKIEDVDIYSCAYYSYTIKDLIFNLKYNNDFNSGEYLVELLYNKIKESSIKVEYITYVPSSKRKLKNKGFNQCEFLAEELAKKLELPCLKTLKKRNNIKEQKKLGFEERKENVKDAFSLENNLKLNDSRILLIDDVITTGATLTSCVKELKKIENIKIIILTIGKSYI